MNLSDIIVPEYRELQQLSIALPAAGILFLVVVVAIAFWRRQRKLGKNTKIALVSVAAVTLIASFALHPAIQGFKDQQDHNFAAALQRTYGATSSVPYTEFAGLGGDYLSELTRDGKSTNVRFEVKDGALVPIALSEETYSKLAGQ